MKLCFLNWIALGLTYLSFVVMVKLQRRNEVAIGGKVSNIKIPLGSINPVMVYHARKNNYDTNISNDNNTLNNSDIYNNNNDEINFDMLLYKNNEDIVSHESERNQNEFLFETPY